MFFKLLEERYHCHSTIITTNLVSVTSGSINCHTVSIDGPSLREPKVESASMNDGRGQEEYIRQILEAYRKTPGTLGTVRHPDRTEC